MLILPIISGFFSGIISGMGIGGGTILIPALSIFLNISQKEAQGVNLLYFIPTAAVALYVHIKNKNIVYKTSFIIAVFGILGAVLGAIIANKMDTNLLRKFFAAFLFAMGIYEIVKKGKKNKKNSLPN